jgi:hypothetical protein
MALASCSTQQPATLADLAPLSVTVREEPRFNALFQRCGPGWTGGDSTYSTPLSGTRVMWLFSDTFIGPVSAQGKRKPATAQFVQGNTLVLQDNTNGTLTTYLRKTLDTQEVTQNLPTFAQSPYDASRCPGDSFIQHNDARAMFQPPQCPSANHCYFWGGGTVAEDARLYTFLQLMEEKGAGVFDFAWRSSTIATLPVDELGSAEPVYFAVPNNGVSYGGAVLADEEYTYIYGVRAEPPGNTVCTGHCLHVARVPKGQLAIFDTWQYWGITPGVPTPGAAAHFGWTGKPSETAPMAGSPDVAAAPRTQDQLGVARVTQCGALPACYVIIAHRYTGAASRDILAWYAAQPQGPWSGPVFVYETPEYDQPGQLFTYNSKIHPEFTNEEGLLVSYDVNSLAPATDPLSAMVTANSYRPRFIRVQLHWGAPFPATGAQRADTASAGHPTSPL